MQTEEVIAGSGNDTLTGSSGDDYLDGGAGADSINGEDGDDDIIGDPGMDTLLGGPGDDLIQARNNDVDQVSGGTNTGVGAGDLASVDSIDIPAVQNNAIQKAQALAAIVPNGVPTSSSNPSDPDTTYGDGGTGFENGPDLGWNSIDAAAVDSQGRVIFVGTKVNSNGGGYGEDMVASRYNADGTPDDHLCRQRRRSHHQLPHRRRLRPAERGRSSRRRDRVRDDSIVVVGSTFVDSSACAADFYKHQRNPVRNCVYNGSTTPVVWTTTSATAEDADGGHECRGRYL